MDESTEVFDLETRRRVLLAVPPSVHEVLARIEAQSGRAVQFLDAHRLKASGIENPGLDASLVNEFGAFVTVENGDAIDANAVTHELLHVHRYVVEGVPQMDAALDVGHDVELMASIDNVLEHLIIVPREKEHGFNPDPHWSAQLIQTFTRNDYRSADHKRAGYLLGWTVTSYCTDQHARAVGLEALQSLGIQREARLLRDSLWKARTSKERMVKTALAALGISEQRAILVRYDIRQGSKDVRPL
uniref:Uncharacterized protein n=1 Tax=Cereibacter sphaeroides (strain ATCC 17025 / ATH 2.4.3) TaxID=349102 RepID=A4WTB6_CERS5